MITIIDYGAGNIRSVLRACAEVGNQAMITSDPAAVAQAGKIIFPGVGAAPSAMKYLKKTGLDTAIKNAFQAGIPILGICLGTQIILEKSEEGHQKCLGLVPGMTVRFNLKDKALKIPHMGWNEITVTQPHPLLEGVRAGDEFYFVHSFYPQPAVEENVYAVADYGGDFCCALGFKNLFATQFHLEKSGRLGLEMLARFARWDGNS
jgi:glutamine amidotransferase